MLIVPLRLCCVLPLCYKEVYHIHRVFFALPPRFSHFKQRFRSIYSSELKAGGFVRCNKKNTTIDPIVLCIKLTNSTFSVNICFVHTDDTERARLDKNPKQTARQFIHIFKYLSPDPASTFSISIPFPQQMSFKCWPACFFFFINFGQLITGQVHSLWFLHRIDLGFVFFSKCELVSERNLVFYIHRNSI